MPKISKLLLVLPLLGTPLLSLGQDTEKVSITRANPLRREEYSVLKADPTIKQGYYQAYAGQKGTALLATGFYTAGRKDSLWTEYTGNGKKVLRKGRYRADQKVGVWEYYTTAGKLSQRFDHTTEKLVFSQEETVTRPLSFFTITQDSPAFTSPPIYVEGIMSMYQTIGRSIRYPATALRNQVVGMVWVTFTIGADGKTSNYFVEKGLGSGCDEEALRVVKLIPENWIPAYVDGQPVAAQCVVPVTYAIR